MIHVFAGPSLPIGDLSVDAVRHPPAARGDLDALSLGPGDVVALIDGVVISGYSPSPQECASVMARGATLWGCSSIGALRAVELRPLGMVGHGWVYQRVLDRTITFDDELVAVLDPRDWSPRTVFLANVRHGLMTSGGLGASAIEEMLSALRQIPVRERSTGAVHAALLELGVARTLAETILGPGHDVKRHDARDMLSVLQDATAARA